MLSSSWEWPRSSSIETATFFGDLDGYANPVVVDGDKATLDVDLDPEGVHPRVPALVAGGVDEDFVEDLGSARAQARRGQ